LEDAVEGVVARVGRRGDLHLHLHELGPSGVSLHAERLHAVLHTGVDVVDLRVQLRDDDHHGDDSGDACRSSHSDHNFCFRAHFALMVG
jgi:hypothetical protein